MSVTSASSAGVAGLPTTTALRRLPWKATWWPLVSGVGTVTCGEFLMGGLHEPNASGGPCVRFAEVHGRNAGTSEKREGVAPFGRG